MNYLYSCAHKTCDLLCNRVEAVVAIVEAQTTSNIGGSPGLVVMGGDSCSEG